MPYSKLISYSDYVELYQYDGEPSLGRRGPRLQTINRLSGLDASGDSLLSQGESVSRVKRKDNARRVSLAFRRLVSANLGASSCPLLITLTYAENIKDLGRGRSDFNAFARAVRNLFGSDVSYIAVPEFQKRGAVHFHALFWGLPSDWLCANERRSRLVAKLWGQGFVDLIDSDGSDKIAGYLAKYMSKAFLDPALAGHKAYICSRNIKRPVVEKNPLLVPYFYGGLQDLPDLSTFETLKDQEFLTQWMGKGRYRLLKRRK